MVSARINRLKIAFQSMKRLYSYFIHSYWDIWLKNHWLLMKSKHEWIKYKWIFFFMLWKAIFNRLIRTLIMAIRKNYLALSNLHLMKNKMVYLSFAYRIPEKRRSELANYIKSFTRYLIFLVGIFFEIFMLINNNNIQECKFKEFFSFRDFALLDSALSGLLLWVPLLWVSLLWVPLLWTRAFIFRSFGFRSFGFHAFRGDPFYLRLGRLSSVW